MRVLSLVERAMLARRSEQVEVALPRRVTPLTEEAALAPVNTRTFADMPRCAREGCRMPARSGVLCMIHGRAARRAAAA